MKRIREATKQRSSLRIHTVGGLVNLVFSLYIKPYQ